MQTQDKDKMELKENEKLITVIKVPPAWPTGIVISDREAIKVSVAEDLAVILSRNAFEQLFGWAYSTYTEISCLGSVRREGSR